MMEIIDASAEEISHILKVMELLTRKDFLPNYQIIPFTVRSFSLRRLALDELTE